MQLLLWTAASTVLCMLQVSGVRAKEIASPAVSVENANAQIWRCTKLDQKTLDDLQSRGHIHSLVVLSAHRDTADILSSTHSLSSLQHLGLLDCTELANVQDLVTAELTENVRKLQHHVGEWMSSSETMTEVLAQHAVRRSVHNRACTLTGQCGGEEDTWFTEYHNVTEIYSWFEGLAEERSSYVTVWRSIGQTHYGRNIMAAHITDSSESSERKLKVYFQCLLHAREWISGPICMYIARYFANPDPSDEMLTKLLKKIEFIIIPVANPDGYHITWVDYPKYRFWRKNLAPTNNPDCDGVDLNRNFDAHWSMEGSSDDPCSELYHGEHASSEREVQAITHYINFNAPVLGAIDFHSYYQEILYPPAWADQDADNVDALDYVSQWMASAAGQAGAQYKAQSMHSIYLAAGTFPDWMLEHAMDSVETECTSLSITVELRPQGDDDIEGYRGFMVPTEQILPTCEEMLSAVIKFSNLVIDKMSSC